MPIVHFPYRWLPRTVFKNLSYGWWYFWNGVRNIARWWRVVWHDQQHDGAFLLLLVEHKLRMMERVHGGHVGDEKQRRDMRVCAELCKRLAAEEVYSSVDSEWRPLPLYFEGLRHSKTRFIEMSRAEAQLFGKIIGSKILTWWS